MPIWQKLDNPARLLLVSVVISFAAKLLLGWVLSDSFFQRGNSYQFLNALALSLLERGEFSLLPGIPSIDYEPLYPAVLATAYGLFGQNWFGVTLIQAGLFAATSWIIFTLGQAVWSRWAGALAATYHSFYPILFFQSLSVIDTTLFVFLALLLVLGIVAWRPSVGQVSLWKYAAVGVVAALLFLLRGSIIAFGPAILFIVLYWLRKDRSLRRFGGYCLSLLVFLAVLTPWVARNHDLTGTIVISSHGSFGLWQGNNERTLYYLKNDISLDRIYQEDPPEIYKRYPLEPRDPKLAVEVAQHYGQAARDFVFSNPGAFLELAAWKMIKFWTPVYNPVGESYSYGGATIRKLANAVSYTPLLILFPFGLWFMGRNPQTRDVAYFFFGIIFFYAAAHAVAMGYTRLRVPIDPLLMILASIAVSEIGRRLMTDSPGPGESKR